MLALDDTQTRLQLAQGRIDVKSVAMDANQPYEIVTPRGTVKLLQQGDYYVEAGSTEDPTRLGVRSGAAQIQALNGQVRVRANEVAEVMAMARARSFAPSRPRRRRRRYWASPRPPDRLRCTAVSLDGVTGYEDLNAYGDWTNDAPTAGVWAPRSVPTAGRLIARALSYVHRGWTWIDEQPWGFEQYHRPLGQSQ